MSLKAKAVGLGLLAALAVATVGVISASAEGVGHITSDAAGPWTALKGTQVGPLGENEVIDDEMQMATTCATAKATAVMDASTETALTAVAEMADCETTEGFSITIEMNGCTGLVTIGNEPETQHQAGQLECPAGKTVRIVTDPPIIGLCTITYPPQSVEGAVALTGVKNGKHHLTLVATAQGITGIREEVGFGCLGTAGHTEAITASGKATVEGFDTNGERVNITVTGS